MIRILPWRVVSAFLLSVLLASRAAAILAAPVRETERRYLSGTGPEDAVQWDFFCTAGRNSRAWSKIAVPSCWELQGFGTYNYGGDSDRDAQAVGNEQGLYRHEFTVPAGWRGRQVRIVFDGAMTDATVWINGRLAGETHQGAFYRFHYDITELLRFDGPNLLEVTVAKVSGNRSVNNAERAADYWIFGGIFRPVWLEARPKLAIERTAIDARADGSIDADVFLTAPSPAAKVTAQLLDADGKPVAAPFVAVVAPNETKVTVRGRLDGAKRWTAETPHLYRVRFTLAGADGTPQHAVTERFGFRTIEVRENDGVYLNGTKIVLKGVNRHCFWPETGRTVAREQSYADVRLIKEANMNAVRCSHYSPDEHFLEACDELGLYVLDELGGWQKSYNTPTGARLIGELIRRDVNHPAIVFWDNGNEGGWNEKNDGEFAKWDPQGRKVLHPWAIHDGINTDHYEHYDSTVKLSAGPQIFMPTEFLHGLYDGGIGAGFRDYWDVMGRSPTVAGGFFWVWSDEGVVRVDQGNKIDNAGNAAPDGMVGPHREKEGSFFAIKEIWSPVLVTAPAANARGELPENWDGTLQVENAYDFTDLGACSFAWELLRAPATTLRRESVAHGELPGPKLAPRTKGTLKLGLPANWRDADALHVTAKGPRGETLWIASWGWARPLRPVAKSDGVPAGEIVETAAEFILRHAGTEMRIARATGLLSEITRDGRTWSLTNGPRFVASRRKDRVFESLSDAPKVRKIEPKPSPSGGNTVGVRVEFAQPASGSADWSLCPDGSVVLAYNFMLGTDADQVGAKVDLLGVVFDCPEANVKSKRWFGRGPYRVWRNRMEGGVLDVHEVAYNDPVPGETYAYPEFKGFFRDWRWLALETAEGRLVIENERNTVPCLGLFRPKDGVKGLMELPETGLAFLDVVPAIGTKFQFPETTGPQGVTPRAGGPRDVSFLRFRFEPK